MPAKKTMILAQLLIALMMAFLMSGIMSFLHLGPTRLWLEQWLGTFIIAWPIAFCLSLVVGPLSFRLARIATRA